MHGDEQTAHGFGEEDRGGGWERRGACYGPRVRLSRLDLNRTTLARQLLLEREALDVVEGVRRVVALQAQGPASPYLALWNRLRGFDPAALDEALRASSVVKAPLMRITLHAVAADDHATFRAAMRSTLRAGRLDDQMLAAAGPSADDVDALGEHVARQAQRPLTREAIEAMLEARLGDAPARGLWRALRTVAPLVHAPTGGPWSFGRTPAFVAGPDGRSPIESVEATQSLLSRYLTAFGPATRRDVAQFALLRQGDLSPAFEALGDALVAFEGPSGEVLYDVSDAPLQGGDVAAPPRLMAMWDSVLLAYADRSRVIPNAYRAHVIRRNGDVLPTVLVDGFVCGVWRHVEDGIEVTAFHVLDERAWQGIAAEASGLLALLDGRDDAVYGRFEHWWRRLDGAQVRVVGRG